MKLPNPFHDKFATRNWRPALLALWLFIAATSSPTVVAAGQREDDARIVTCRIWMTEVTETLSGEPPLRDEAYTAIMWARLDAEDAYAARDGAACLAALEVPRRVLGLPLESDADAGAAGTTE